jgi:transposase
MNGRKRHNVVDRLGLTLRAVVHPADLQDRGGAPVAPRSIRKSRPCQRHIFANGGYAGPAPRGALKGQGYWRVEIIKRRGPLLAFWSCRCVG